MAGTGRGATEQVGQFLTRYMPLVVMLCTIVASATAAQIQINQNAERIAQAMDGIERRVPRFLYDEQMGRLLERVADVEADTEDNEEIIEGLERGTDKINAKIELEVERLRNAIERNDTKQAQQLENIIILLEQQRENQ